VVPFLLESALRERGAVFESSAPFECHVVVDGRIITGQNPASAKAVAQKMLSFLEQKEYRDAEVSHEASHLR
jgi:putative intracellular protease/amidase